MYKNFQPAKEDIKIEDRLIIGIDTSSKERILLLCNEIGNRVSTLKLGLEVIYSNGLDIVKSVISFGYKVMLDVKFLDIPNTIANASRAVVNLGVSKMTVHATGGEQMLKGTRDAVMKESEKLQIIPPEIFAVTILTSLSNTDLNILGFKNNYLKSVLNLAELAVSAGIYNIVCSPNEVSFLREHLGNSFKVATPGIRLEEDDSTDQKRFNTPFNAIKNGADYLIVGRSITSKENPAEAVKTILEQISKAT